MEFARIDLFIFIDQETQTKNQILKNCMINQ